MGYLNNTSVVVDAILTKKGRELLAKGEDQFKITQFALGDDDQKQTISAVGLKFQLTSKAQPNATIKTQLTVVGNETGGTTTIDVTVDKTVLTVT